MFNGDLLLRTIDRNGERRRVFLEFWVDITANDFLPSDDATLLRLLFIDRVGASVAVRKTGKTEEDCSRVLKTLKRRLLKEFAKPPGKRAQRT
jgi:hypothetical protein